MQTISTHGRGGLTTIQRIEAEVVCNQFPHQAGGLSPTESGGRGYTQNSSTQSARTRDKTESGGSRCCVQKGSTQRGEYTQRYKYWRQKLYAKQVHLGTRIRKNTKCGVRGYTPKVSTRGRGLATIKRAEADAVCNTGLRRGRGDNMEQYR